MRLPGGAFSFGAYLREQQEGTEWLAARLERSTGMASFVTAWHATHRPTKRHPERTLKSYAFQEAESRSREAKVEWCEGFGRREGQPAVTAPACVFVG